MKSVKTTIGVVRESGQDERRVALVPKAIGGLKARGLAVVVEPGAGGGRVVAR
jgi:NAD(P) transhydrogenase subunit alpha